MIVSNGRILMGVRMSYLLESESTAAVRVRQLHASDYFRWVPSSTIFCRGTGLEQARKPKLALHWPGLATQAFARLQFSRNPQFP